MMSADPRPCVAFFHWLFLGYTETFLYQQLKRLSRYRPAVFALKTENLDRFPHEPIYLPDPLPENRVAANLRWLLHKAYVPGWDAILRRERAQVIHAHYGPVGLRAALVKRRLGIPLVTSFYGFDVGVLERPLARENLRAWPLYVTLPRVLWREGDLFLALSGTMRDDLVRLGCPAEKIHIQPNGVDLARFAPRERPERPGCVVAMCGWEVEKKGFAYGFRAVRQAIDQGADLRVRWLGVHGPLRQSLLDLIRELGLSERVEVLDERADPAELFASADLILAPSVTDARGNKEGVPTVLVEASASGLPAVASRHAGIPEIVEDGASGLLFPERDVEGLTSGLLRLARDPALRRTFGERARQRAAASYDAAKIALRLEELYDQVAAPYRARRGW